MNRLAFLEEIKRTGSREAALQFADWLEEHGDPLCHEWRKPIERVALTCGEGNPNWASSPFLNEFQYGAGFAYGSYGDKEGGGTGNGYSFGYGLEDGDGKGDGGGFGARPTPGNGRGIGCIYGYYGNGGRPNRDGSGTGLLNDRDGSGYSNPFEGPTVILW